MSSVFESYAEARQTEGSPKDRIFSLTREGKEYFVIAQSAAVARARISAHLGDVCKPADGKASKTPAERLAAKMAALPEETRNELRRLLGTT